MHVNVETLIFSLLLQLISLIFASLTMYFTPFKPPVIDQDDFFFVTKLAEQAQITQKKEMQNKSLIRLISFHTEVTVSLLPYLQPSTPKHCRMQLQQCQHIKENKQLISGTVSALSSCIIYYLKTKSEDWFKKQVVVVSVPISK